MARKRHLSRIAVMQTLFELERHPADQDRSLLLNIAEIGELDTEFAKELLAGVAKHRQNIEATIEEHAPGWSLERMDPIARTTLLVGVYELMFLHDVPAAVVMNEAIDIAKEFGTAESGKFVNGVMNAVAQKRLNVCTIILIIMTASSMPMPFIHLEKAIGMRFHDKELLVCALTHRSAFREVRIHGHNERLEFLGDAVLELVTTEYLFQYKEKSEGELTNWRAALVKGEHLAVVAKNIKLGEYIFMSKGEEASGGREKESTLANTLEALIGAIFLDQGYAQAKLFCFDNILIHLNELVMLGKHKDEKSLFQEKAQEFHGLTPHYVVESDSGPDHDKVSVCAVYIGEERIAEGKGAQQKAEQEAAKAGLKVKRWK